MIADIRWLILASLKFFPDDQNTSDYIRDQCSHLQADGKCLPGNKLDESGRELDAGLGVEDGGVRVSDEVGGNDVLVGVAQVALQRALGSLPAETRQYYSPSPS